MEAANQCADGMATQGRLESTRAGAQAASVDAFHLKGEVGGNAGWAAFFAASPFVELAASRASKSAFVAAGDGPKPGPEHAAQCHLLRCFLGPFPFRVVGVDNSWLEWGDSTVANGDIIPRPVYGDGLVFLQL